MDPQLEASLIALGIQSLDNLFNYFAQRKTAAGLSDQDLLNAAAQINDGAIARTQSFLDKLSAAPAGS